MGTDKNPAPVTHVAGDDWFSQIVSFFVEHGMLDAREEYDIGDVMAALADNYEPARVKSLEWLHYDSGDACARSVITAYFAHTDGSWCVRNGSRIQAGTTLADAKSAAQAHYDASIRAALATTEGSDNG